jgi:hypothetical protein
MSNIERIKALYIKFDAHVAKEDYADAQNVICLINDLKYQALFDKENTTEGE